MPPGAYQAEPPEATSAQFWLGPGAGSFFASAANLKALAAAIIGMLGGHVSTEAAMAASWPSLSGEIARLAHTPHLGWLATAGAMVAEAGMAIDATAASFETSKFATPHPGEVATNQSEHVALNNANAFGFLTPLIIANRIDYGRMWMQGVTNKYAYETGSVPLHTVPPVPPPPPSTAGASGSGAPGLDQGSAEAPMDSFFQQLTGMLPAIGQMPMSLMQSVGSGGPLKSLTEVPQQFLGQMGSLASAANLSPEAALDGAATSDWVTATPWPGARSTRRWPAAARVVSAGRARSRRLRRCAVPAPGRRRSARPQPPARPPHGSAKCGLKPPRFRPQRVAAWAGRWRPWPTVQRRGHRTTPTKRRNRPNQARCWSRRPICSGHLRPCR